MAVEDYRNTNNTKPVWREKMAQFTWAAAVSTAVVKDIVTNGRMRWIIGTANDSTNAITYTTTIADSDGTVLYTKTDWAEAATEKVQLTSDNEIFIPSGSTMTITPSGVPGTTGGTFDVTLIGI
jgi:hypothetical protein